MAINFPTSLDTFTTKTTADDVEAAHMNDPQDAIEALEIKMGIDGSAVTTSHDYRINRQGVQTVITENSTTSTGTTTVPDDDTIPQNTEGDEWMTVTITPTNTNNILVFEISAWFYSDADSPMIGALFQDSTASAIRAGRIHPLPRSIEFPLYHRMVAGTTSSTTFKFRAGQAGSHTMTINGVSGARKLGGVMVSYIKVTEWKV